MSTGAARFGGPRQLGDRGTASLHLLQSSECRLHVHISMCMRCRRWVPVRLDTADAGRCCRRCLLHECNQGPQEPEWRGAACGWAQLCGSDVVRWCAEPCAEPCNDA